MSVRRATSDGVLRSFGTRYVVRERRVARGESEHETGESEKPLHAGRTVIERAETVVLVVSLARYFIVAVYVVPGMRP